MTRNERHIAVTPDFRDEVERAQKKLAELGFKDPTLKESADLIRKKSSKIFMSDQEIVKWMNEMRNFGRF